MDTWKDLHGRAMVLIHEVKEHAASGFENMEDQQRYAGKLKEADDLIERAKVLKGIEDKANELDAVIAAADGGTTAQGVVTDRSIAGLAANRGTGAPIVDTGKEPEFANPFKKGWRVVAEQRVARDWRAALPALDKLQKAALAEGAGSTGGYLVVPQYMQDLFAGVRRQGNVLRALGWLNEHQTAQTNTVLIPKASGSLTMGIVSELQAKPTADNAYAQITVGIYTFAGIANIAKQLADDADPAVIEIVAQDLALLLGNLEEQNVYSGTGTGAPRGILNTAGTSLVPTATQTALNGAVTGGVLLDAIIDAYAAVKTNYFASATGVVMRPLRLALIQKTKDSAGNYLINAPGTFRAPGIMTEGYTSGALDTVERTWDFLGIPIATSANMPNTLSGTPGSIVIGGGAQDAIIIAAWREAHWFNRQDATVDASDVAGDAFETNKVKYRLEERAGFTAERYPAAFCIATGSGMTGT